MAFFLCNMMETHFLSTGAFEVTLNGGCDCSVAPRGPPPPRATGKASLPGRLMEASHVNYSVCRRAGRCGVSAAAPPSARHPARGRSLAPGLANS